MKVFTKILKITSVVIASVVIILLAGSLYFQDAVADHVLKYFQSKIATKYSYSSISLSLLSRFPDASLHLNDVVVISSPHFDKKSFNEANTDTLLQAKSVSVEFSIFRLLSKEYDIESITIKDGSVNLFSDASGGVNYEIISKEKNRDTFELNLERIGLSNIRASFNNLALNLRINGKIDKAVLKSLLSSNTVDLKADASMKIDSLCFNSINVKRPTDAVLKVSLKSSKDGVHFDKSTLKINKNNLALSGSVTKQKDIDLSITGGNLSITDIKSYLPPQFLEKVKEYSTSGIMDVNGKIVGKISRTSNPKMTFDFLVHDGVVERNRTSQSIKNLYIKGSYSNGTRMTSETSSLKIDDISGLLGNYAFRGALNTSNFDSPSVSLFLSGHGDAKDIVSFFPTEKIDYARGILDVTFKAKGIYKKGRSYSLPDLFEFNPTLDIKVDSFAIALNNKKIAIDMMMGNIFIDDNVVVDNLAMKYEEQSFLVDGSFANLTHRLVGEKDAVIRSTVNLTCDKLLPETFIGEENEKSEENGRLQKILFPKNMMFDIAYDIGDFSYKQYYASDIRGDLSYKPYLLSVTIDNLNTLDGSIDGDGFLTRNKDKSLLSSGTFDLKDVNIKKGFDVFNNFGQDFIKGEHLNGSLSGQISLLIPMDSSFTPQINAISADGNYVISDGALINFEPIKQLSRFIELSELENIHFEKLENELYIRNNLLYIPQMDIKSSAANISINGKHRFDNEYEYHLKVLLSDILSKKYRKPKEAEFANIEDDGLGRTSLMLTLSPQGVKYDMKAVGNKIKTEIKEEKQALRTILKEEYGLFKKDTIVRKAEETKEETSTAPRFKVIWEEMEDETTMGDEE